MRPSNIWSQSSMIMALSSDFPGVYTERPIKNIKVQNLLLYVFGMAFSVVAICWYQRAHYYWVAALLSPYVASSQWLGRVSGDEICREYCKVALLLTTVVSVYLFNFHVSLAFLLGSSKLTAFASVNTINLTFSHKIA
ncbi:hypothetical protein HID58_073375 [Brassica napus]|uniref:Uncharacterized protein n=1 Tax=Brassica napus TaxID=3708 RepID=A0ABQ7Z7A5_BRANA|nr:hypothetical protein HID58_073375 [Brassica napus]